MLFPTSLVGSYPQPDWLIDRARLAGRFPPRVRARELWRIDPQLIPWQAAQSFDVKGRPSFWIFPNPQNVICPENENVSSVRLNKVVAKLVDKDLIPRIHCAPGNNFTAMIGPPGENVEIMTERLGRRINQKVLPLTNQAR